MTENLNGGKLWARKYTYVRFTTSLFHQGYINCKIQNLNLG